MIRKVLLSLAFVLAVALTLQLTAASLSGQIQFASQQALVFNTILATGLLGLFYRLTKRKNDAILATHRHLRICLPIEEVAETVQSVLQSRQSLHCQRTDSDHQIVFDAKTSFFSRGGRQRYTITIERESQNASQLDLSYQRRFLGLPQNPTIDDEVLNEICNALSKFG